MTTKSRRNLRAFCNQVESSFYSKKDYYKDYIKIRDDLQYHFQIRANKLFYYYYKYNINVYNRK